MVYLGKHDLIRWQVFEHCASKILHIVSGGQRDCYLKVWKQCLLDILPLSLDPINLLTPPPPLS